MVQTKALYNMLRMRAESDPPASSGQGQSQSRNQPQTQPGTKPWAVEDLRPVSINEIWIRLKEFGIQLDKPSFIQFSSSCTNPEELTDLLIDEDEETESTCYDPVYLLIFELWRRLLPEKSSLSIFADELDHQINLYVKEEMQTDEPLQNALAELSEILDEHIDRGMKPKDAYLAISDYCANDLESFLYLYISDLLDQENLSYAQELLEEFSPYFPKHATFDFLQIRVLNFTDPHEANQKLHAVLLKKQPLTLLFDILQFLVDSGEHEIFIKTVRQIFIQLKTEEELIELIDLSADYFARLDKEDLEQALLRIKERRQNVPLVLNPVDPDVVRLKEILQK